MNKRETAKEERRRAIIEAARAMIRETGNAALPMRALAERAGVSQATPYNLFGTKRAVVLAVLQDMDAFNRRYLEAPPVTGPIDRILDALDTMAGMYADDPVFYRIVWHALFEEKGADARSEFEFSRRVFFRHLMQTVAEQGLLIQGLSPELLAMQMEQALFGTASAWLFDYVGPDHLQPLIGFNACLILSAATVPAERAWLEAKMRAHHERLVALGLPSEVPEVPEAAKRILGRR